MTNISETTGQCTQPILWLPHLAHNRRDGTDLLTTEEGWAPKPREALQCFLASWTQMGRSLRLEVEQIHYWLVV